MKRIISLLLALLMFTSLGIPGFADENDVLTADLVLERLAEGDEASETPEDQAANGMLRLAEMVVALDSINIETQDEADHLNRILDKLAEVDVSGESIEHKLAMGSVKTFEALMIFQQQVDPEGSYADDLHSVFDSFLSNDDAADGAKQQAINGLYHSVVVTSLIARGFCRDQTMVRQIETELEAFQTADKTSASTDLDQLVLGSETLFRMLTAVASVIDSDGTFADAVQELSENTYAADNEENEQLYRLANWLYGCVYMTEIIAEEIEA